MALRKLTESAETSMNAPSPIPVIIFAPIYLVVSSVRAIKATISLTVPSVKTSMSVNSACMEKIHLAQTLTVAMTANVTKEAMIPMQIKHRPVFKKPRRPVKILPWCHLASISMKAHSQSPTVAITAFALIKMKLELHVIGGKYIDVQETCPCILWLFQDWIGMGCMANIHLPRKKYRKWNFIFESTRLYK